MTFSDMHNELDVAFEYRVELAETSLNTSLFAAMTPRTLLLLVLACSSPATGLPSIDLSYKGRVVFGREEAITSFAALTTSSSLPTSFTICSSISADSTFTSIALFQLLSNTGQPWLMVLVERMDTRDEVMLMVDSSAGVRYSNHTLHRRPMKEFWSHGCVSVDTISGRLIIVLNGETIEDKIFKDLTGATDKIPRDLSQKLLLGKVFQGFWYQCSQRVANVNVWGSVLGEADMAEITTTVGCGREGDLLPWKKMEWKLEGEAVMDEVTKEELCHEESNILVLTAGMARADECIQACPKLQRARAAPVRTAEEGAKVLERLVEVVVQPGAGTIRLGMESLSTWLAISDSASEGNWSDAYTGERILEPQWVPGEPDGGDGANCALLVVPWQGWVDWTCQAPRSQVIFCACHLPNRPLLRLRGLCSESAFDTEYLAHNRLSDGQLTFFGLHNSVIDFQNGSWHLRTFGSDANATSSATKESLLLGKRKWTVEKDLCQDGSSFDRILKLTGCRKDEFTCNDGECITMEQRCDRLVHCRDSSDEQDCKILVLEENYNKRVPPLPDPDQRGGESFHLQLNVSLTVGHVQNIDETRGTFQLNFESCYEWFERRVSFHNLKQKAATNSLLPEEYEKLWLPEVRYSRTTERIAKVVAAKVITVSKQGGFVRSGKDVTDEIEIYAGAENKLSMKETRVEEFLCSLHTFWYPFDKQVSL